MKQTQERIVLDKAQLLDEKMKKLAKKFPSLKFPVIINRVGDIVYSLVLFEDLPSEFGAYIVSARKLSEKFYKLFVPSTKCKQLKIKGENRAIFTLYFLDENYFLAFYTENDLGYHSVFDPKIIDDEIHEYVEEIKLLLTSSIEIV